MEPPLLRFVLLSFSLLFIIFADFVESQSSNRSPPPPSPVAPPPPSPPSPSPPPPPPPAHSPSSSHFRPPPPPKHHKNQTNHHRRRPPPSHPPHSHNHKLNTGKKLGLLFIGIFIILQIGVVGFLVFKRRQLLKVKGTYESCSSSS
ncbi:hypothetical protein CRYUN_Cryun37aG0064400 [Craigia yunnanensis]